MNESRGAVVVTDAFWPKTLVAVRSLADAGERVVCGEQSRLAPALWSRSCARRFLYPDPAGRPDGFLSRLEAIAREETARAGGARPVLLAMEEETLLCVLRHRARLEQSFAIPFAQLELIEALGDKAWTLQLARLAGVPVLPSQQADSTGELERAECDLGLPLVVKLRVSSGARGVFYAEDSAQLQHQFRRAIQLQSAPLVQRRIPREGEALGVSVLLRAVEGEDSELVAAFVHRRLREYPVTGGSSTYREAVRDDELVDHARRMLAPLGFHGVAMLEFKRDARDGQIYLLEVNPRFWGSLHQAVIAGVPFPALLVQLARGECPEPVLDYRTDVRSRAWFPGDLLHFLRANPRPAWREFFRVGDPGVREEAFSLDDPLPGLLKCVSWLGLATAPGIRRLLRPAPTREVPPPRRPFPPQVRE